MFVTSAGINRIEDETSLASPRSLNAHREPEARQSTDHPKVNEGSSSVMPSLTLEWTTRETAKDVYTSPPSVLEKQESLSFIGSLEEVESVRVQQIEEPTRAANEEKRAVTYSTTTFTSVNGGFVDAAESVRFQPFKELSRVSDKEERTLLNDSLTTSMLVNATVSTTSEANLLETDTIASSIAAEEDSTITTTPDMSTIILTLASDATAPTNTTKTANTPTNALRTTSTVPDTTAGETTANNKTTATPITTAGTPNAATTIPTTSPSKATQTPPAPRMYTLNTNQRKIKPGRNEVTASFKGKLNRIKKNVLHPFAQEQNITTKDYRRSYQEDEEETKIEKSASHPPEQEQTIAEQNSKSFSTSTQEDHLRGYEKEEEEEGYRERKEEEEHIAKAHDEEEESLTTSEGEDNNEELEAIVRQMRSVLVGSHRKARASKRSKAFEHSDSQMHFDIFNGLREIQMEGRGRQSSGKLMIRTFGYSPDIG